MKCKELNYLMCKKGLGGSMIDPTLSVAITATRMMFSAYSGYQKGKLANSDQSLREEVRRRADGIKNQIYPLYKKAHRNKLRELRSEIQEVMDICDEFADSAKYSISHTPNSKHDAAVQLKKKSLKMLVEHDFNTLDKLVNCEKNISTLIDEGYSEGSENSMCKEVGEIRGLLVDSKNYFTQRNMIIDGYIKK
tara:strand:+ start:116 stop:694 length:579 start_codon:yes stop_codon:yes gene_type:complete